MNVYILYTNLYTKIKIKQATHYLLFYYISQIHDSVIIYNNVSSDQR